MKRMSVISAGTALVLVLAACASGESPDAAEPTPTPETSAEVEAQKDEVTEAAATDSGPQPVVGECWNTAEYSLDGDIGDPVDCSDEHTQRTIAVLELPDDYPDPRERSRALDERDAITDKESPDYDQAQLKLIEFNLSADAPNGPYRQCSMAKNEAVGAVDPWQGTYPYVHLVTFPNEEQWAEGQRWARCNLIKRKNLTTQKLVPLPASLPKLTPISMQSSVCELKKRRVACSKLTDKQVEDGRWYFALGKLPKPEGSPIAKDADEAYVLAEDACIEQLRGKIDPRALENDYIRATLGSNFAAAQWIEQGKPTPFSEFYWNADDASIDCEVPTWAVRK
jgi:hypothetical protein